VGDPDVWETTERRDDAACINKMQLRGGWRTCGDLL